MTTWNGNRFSIYTSDERSALGLIKQLGDQTNFNTDELENKTDLNGDHKGTWQGLNPTQTIEGGFAQVDTNTREIRSIKEREIITDELLKNKTDYALTIEHYNELKELISQGVTNEQIESAIQKKIQDGSIASISLSSESVKPINLNNGTKAYQPIIWTISETSVVTNGDTITIGNNVGVIYRDKFMYATPGTYQFTKTDQYLVLRNVTLGTTATTHTPILVARNGENMINDSDIILAYYGGQITTIWDSFINTKKVNNITPLGGYACITSMYPFNIDTTNKIITFHENTWITYKNVFKQLTSTTIDITNALKGGHLYFDITNDVVTDKRPTHLNYCYLGTMWCRSDYNIIAHVNGECAFTINGVPYLYNSAKYKGETANFLGDSITEGVGCTRPYHQWLYQLCGFSTINNLGIGGSTIARRPDDSISWDTKTPFVDRVQTMPEGKINVIYGGINDHITGRDIGDMSSTSDTTIYGAMKKICEYFVTNYPSRKLYFITPYQYNYKLRPPVGGRTDGKNKLGYTLQDYIKAIKEVANYYGFPVLELDKNCYYGLSETLNTKYFPDYLHYNDLGHKEKLAPVIGSFLNNN